MEVIQSQESLKILMGNEAIARGFLDQGAQYFAAYPGTPSTEIVEYVLKHQNHYDTNVHWTTNEAVAMEEAAAAAISGKFSVFVAKHVGLNVAADPMMTVAYMGVRGALVICVADDPSLHSSQNEQDSRWWGKFAHLPVIEPTDPANAYYLARKALEFSHILQLPVILRVTTRISHGLAPVIPQPAYLTPQIEYKRDTKRFVSVPANARNNKLRLNRAMEQAESLSNSQDWTFTFVDHKKPIGIISSGTAASYCQEIYEEQKDFDLFIPYLTSPLPKKHLLQFIRNHVNILVVEELDDVLEREIKLLAFDNQLQPQITGKKLIPKDFELNGRIIREAIQKMRGEDVISLPIVQLESDILLDRPPNLCSGCPHRSTYYSLTKAFRKKEVIYSNDIGCYSLGLLPPFQASDSTVCMGGSIGLAAGYAKSLPEKTVVAIIGDSTFWHSGLSAMVNAIWQNLKILVVIMDNSVTAMTGMQSNPSSQSNLSITQTVQAMGAKVWETNAFETKALIDLAKSVVDLPGVKVIVSKGPCVINYRKLTHGERSYIAVVNHEECTLCNICTEKVNCPGIMNIDKEIQIDENECTGCNLCVQACPRKAIELVRL